MKRLPSIISSRIEVEFNGQAEPIGDGSVKLSSYLGPLVRECVPVTLDNWKHLSEELKTVLWESIQVRNNQLNVLSFKMFFSPTKYPDSSF